MKSPWQSQVIDIWYDNHPHWVVDYGCYSITLRCRGTLPVAIHAQLKEIGETLRKIDPADERGEALRRQHFAILDHTLDSGSGPLPFTGATAAKLHEWIQGYSQDGLHFDHWVIMPNHWHLLTGPIRFASVDEFRMAWRRFKARAARHTNKMTGKSGSLWQNSFYDRWVRDRAEYQRWVDYFRKNPVKAKLAQDPESYPYLQ